MNAGPRQRIKSVASEPIEEQVRVLIDGQNELFEQQEEQGRILSHLEQVVESIDKHLQQLNVLPSIRNEIHDLKDALIKPLVKIFIIMAMVVLLVGTVAVVVGIGVHNFSVNPSSGISFESEKRHRE